MNSHISVSIVALNKKFMWVSFIEGSYSYIFDHAVLYAFFGLRLLYIAWRSSDSKSNQKKEMEEVSSSRATYVATCLVLARDFA